MTKDVLDGIPSPLIHSSVMTRLFLLALLAFAFTPSARALDLKTIETDMTWNTYASSWTSATSKTIDIAGYGSVGFSSSTANITGFRYKILPVGGSAAFTVSVTTRTYAAIVGSVAGFNNPSPTNLKGSRLAGDIVTTSLATIPAGTTMADAYEGVFEAQAVNPVFTFSGLSTAATYYIYVEYGTPKHP